MISFKIRLSNDVKKKNIYQEPLSTIRTNVNSWKNFSSKLFKMSKIFGIQYSFTVLQSYKTTASHL